jgi:hypothetical protein
MPPRTVSLAERWPSDGTAARLVKGAGGFVEAARGGVAREELRHADLVQDRCADLRNGCCEERKAQGHDKPHHHWRSFTSRSSQSLAVLAPLLTCKRERDAGLDAGVGKFLLRESPYALVVRRTHGLRRAAHHEGCANTNTDVRETPHGEQRCWTQSGMASVEPRGGGLRL